MDFGTKWQAVNVVAQTGVNISDQDVNLATELLWVALGGTEDEVSTSLEQEPGLSLTRFYRDDITIIVVYL